MPTPDSRNAILIWTCVLSFTIAPEIYAANVNSRTLDSRNHAAISRQINITRSHDGDLLSIVVKSANECNDNLCMEISTSTAMKYRKSKNQRDNKFCKCQCLNHLKTYREDKGICVNDVGECSLISFVSSKISTETAEQIPFVFLPLKGQIVYPSKELFFADEFENQNCVVVGGVLLTTNGWAEMRTLFNSGDIPFRIFDDENRKFLQWTGDANIRTLMQGRVVMVHLACRINGPSAKTVNTSPCISFRVVGTPVKTTNNVTEVLFATENHGTEKESLSTNEYAVIAISSFCLGLMYIASVFLYIYIKKKKDAAASNGSIDLDKNFSHEASNEFANVRSSYRRNSSLGPSVEFIDNPEPHVVKSNPLMKHMKLMSFNENNGFMSDSSDAESTNIHNESHNNMESHFSSEDAKSMTQINTDSECLPEEDVSITEESESKQEMNRPNQHGSVRRKLYFNPAYFEPSLLASPPPSAIQFLTNIREVITMAKGKMAAKRFRPSLHGIPEEQSSGGEPYSPATINSRKSSQVSSKRASSKDCNGCPGCEAKKSSESQKNCKNCGDKQKSIQKWLENVSTATESSNGSDTSSVARTKPRPYISSPIMEDQNEESSKNYGNEKCDSVEVPVNKTIDVIPIPKGYVKEKNIFIKRDTSRYDDDAENSGSIPKIISHSLKKNIKEMIYSQNFVRDKVSVFESKQDVPAGPVKFEANEIYNNPKFNIDQDGSESSRPYSAVNKRNSVVLDQYANPVKRTTSVPKFESNLAQMPDMIYEAIEMEKKNKPNSYQQLPTPDYYSSEYEITRFKKSDGVSFIPFVPTPDYHTYGKNTLRSLKHYQPDSPIYSRKSPAYLVVDYETDSLERLNTRSRSDVSSQPAHSPSSSALPMEEEVEIRNAIYDRQEGFRKDTDTIKKEREIDIQMKKTKIMYNTPIEGRLTIELEGISPDETDGISATDSDQFEPDTLDRHSKINRTVLEKIKMERNSENGNFVRDDDEAKDTFGEMERIMTLEVRHSKRQRSSGFASLEKHGLKLPDESPKKQSAAAIPPPDVISSIQLKKENIYGTKPFQNSPRVTNQHILDDHEFKKSLISPPILSIESEVRKVNKTLRGDYLKMDSLSLESNFHENQIRNEFQPTLVKTVNYLEMPEPPNLSKDIFTDSGKKSKDFKNAWRRFMNFTEKNEKNTQDIVAAEINSGKVKDIIKRLNVQVTGKQREYDSGYLSAESINNDSLLTEIIPKPEINDKTIRISRPRPADPPPPAPKAFKSECLDNADLVNIHIYSSDEEQQSSVGDSDGEDFALDDGTESGTESWKFFKT